MVPSSGRTSLYFSGRMVAACKMQNAKQQPYIILTFYLLLREDGCSLQQPYSHILILIFISACDVGAKLGRHPFIRLFMKGVFNQRPPKAKLSHTWDPRVVFDYAKNLGSSATLPIRVLAMKATTLLALAAFLRVSEIATIDFSSVVQIA
jgi:hypothetical protein